MINSWPEPMPGCLSAFRVSKAALDELDADERAMVIGHLASCARCAAKVASEREKVAASADEPVPAALREPVVRPLLIARLLSQLAQSPPRRKAARVWLGVGGTLALAAAALLVALPPKESGVIGERPKGNATIELAVQRGGRMLGEPTAVADAPILEAGDRLRLRVRRSMGIYAAVKAYDEGAWVEVFRGAIPEDSWLPIGLVVTAGDPARLRVAVCHDPLEGEIEASVPSGCSYDEINLRVR